MLSQGCILTRLRIFITASSGELISRMKRVPKRKSPISLRSEGYCEDSRRKKREGEGGREGELI